MPTRPFTDIQAAISGNPVKNGTLITGAQLTGQYSLNNNYVQEYPTIAIIDNKYGDRFYNGIFVELVGSQTVVGG